MLDHSKLETIVLACSLIIHPTLAYLLWSRLCVQCVCRFVGYDNLAYLATLYEFIIVLSIHDYKMDDVEILKLVKFVCEMAHCVIK